MGRLLSGRIIIIGKFAVLAVAIAVLGAGCQTYNHKTQTAIEHWNAGDAKGAAEAFSADCEKDNKDSVVIRLEKGTALRAAGQYRESIAAFDAAEQQIDGYDERAKTSISHETAALLSNQANLPYEGRDYDRVMLNTYKALDYMQLGESDRARAELIRASQRQQDAEENNKRKIEKAEEAANKLAEAKDENGKPVKGADQGKQMADKAQEDPKFTQQIQNNYGYLDEFGAKAVYVNPLVYYLNGLYFMAANGDHSDLDRARDAFRFTLGSIGENKFIQQDLDTVDKMLSGGTAPSTTYVIFETGRAPMRDEIRVDVPLFIVGARNVPYVGAAFPTLKFLEGQVPSLTVTAGGVTETTVLLASMDKMIGQSFKNELPTIITKTLISTVVKAAAAYGANKAMEKESVWAQLIVKVVTTAYQVGVNIADTRTWNTLPKEFQFCRVPTPPDHRIQLATSDGFWRTEVTVPDDKVNLVYVKSFNEGKPVLASQVRFNGVPGEMLASSSVTASTEVAPEITVPARRAPAPPITVAENTVVTSAEPEQTAAPSVAAKPAVVMDPPPKKAKLPKTSPKSSGPVFQDVGDIKYPGNTF